MFGIFAILIAACQGKIATQNEQHVTTKIDTSKQVIDTIALTKSDTAFVLKNKLIKDDIGDKQKEYIISISFTDRDWPKLTYHNAIGAELFLPGDLDGDGLPELLLRPEWFSSCWASINLFSLKNKEWKLIKSGSMYFCSDAYPLAKRVLKTDKGFGLLTDSLTEDKFITLKKEIKF